MSLISNRWYCAWSTYFPTNVARCRRGGGLGWVLVLVAANCALERCAVRALRGGVLGLGGGWGLSFDLFHDPSTSVPQCRSRRQALSVRCELTFPNLYFLSLERDFILVRLFLLHRVVG